MKVPCVGCPKAGCGAYHDQCESYQAFKEEQKLIYKERREERLLSEENYHRIARKIQPL